MEAKDIVKTEGELCTLVCQEYRAKNLEAKNCDGLDCGKCQLEKQAELSFKAGMKEVVEWINTHNHIPNGTTLICINIEALEKQLKEWGINQ